MSVHQLVLLLSWDVECSSAWGGSRGSAHRACPTAAPTLRSQVLPSTATPQGKPASALHHPLLPPAPASSLHCPPAPRPSQHLPHSPLPTSSSLPHLQELTHLLPQPPTAPGPPARQLSCLWTRGSAQATCHVQPHTAMPGTCPRQGAWSASPSMSPPAWGIPVPALPGPGITLRLEAGKAPWSIHAPVLFHTSGSQTSLQDTEWGERPSALGLSSWEAPGRVGASPRSRQHVLTRPSGWS